MTIDPIPLDDFPRTGRPWNNITPFTYRDGLTYLEVLEALRAWVRDVLTAHLNDEMEEFAENWNQVLNDFQVAVIESFDQKMEEFDVDVQAFKDAVNAQFDQLRKSLESDIANQLTTVNDALAAWDETYATFTANIQALVDQWTAVQITNNDTITESIIRDQESLTTTAMHEAIEERSADRGRVVLTLNDGIVTSELVEALNTLEVMGGGTLELPAGSFQIEETLMLAPDVRIVGQSKGTHLWTIGDYPLLQARKRGTSRSDGIALENLRLSRHISVSSTPIIDLTQVSHSSFVNLEIRQGTSRSNSVGVELGLDSYYNTFEGVVVRDCATGFLIHNSANANRFQGGTLALRCDDGYVVSGNTNGNLFMGASAEIITNHGWLFELGALRNAVIGCRAEDVGTAYRVVWTAVSPAFNNYFAFNTSYLRAEQVEYAAPTDNVIIDLGYGSRLKRLKRIDERTAIDIAQTTLSVAANTWTKVPFDITARDSLGEWADATFTATEPGEYNITGSIGFDSTENSEYMVELLTSTGTRWLADGAGTGDTTVAVNYNIILEAGGTLAIRTRGTEAHSITGGTGRCRIAIYRTVG